MIAYVYKNQEVEIAPLGPLPLPAPCGRSLKLLFVPFRPRYVIFLNEQRSQLRARHPDLPFTEITKILAAQWAQLSQEKKQVSPFLRRTRRKWPPLPTASIRGCSPPPAHLFTQEPQGTFWKAGMNCLSPHPLKEMLVLPCFWLPPFSKLG